MFCRCNCKPACWMIDSHRLQDLRRFSPQFCESMLCMAFRFFPSAMSSESICATLLCWLLFASCCICFASCCIFRVSITCGFVLALSNPCCEYLLRSRSQFLMDRSLLLFFLVAVAVRRARTRALARARQANAARNRAHDRAGNLLYCAAFYQSRCFMCDVLSYCV